MLCEDNTGQQHWAVERQAKAAVWNPPSDAGCWTPVSTHWVLLFSTFPYWGRSFLGDAYDRNMQMTQGEDAETRKARAFPATASVGATGWASTSSLHRDSSEASVLASQPCDPWAQERAPSRRTPRVSVGRNTLAKRRAFVFHEIPCTGGCVCVSSLKETMAWQYHTPIKYTTQENNCLRYRFPFSCDQRGIGDHQGLGVRALNSFRIRTRNYIVLKWL